LTAVDVVHVVARVALGAVFVVAGASKLSAGRAWPEQAGQLGVARPIALAVPWFELALGAMALVGLVPSAVAAVALAALTAFTAVLVRTLRQGRRPPCACFGAWSARPLGWQHVVRNAAFASLAVVALVTS
jgi:uncharacterized membrane protein YphA (DoxX/SURF4 family)